MSQREESSVVVSLQELMRLSNERVEEERAAARAHAEAEERRAREESERARVEAELAARQAAEEAHREEIRRRIAAAEEEAARAAVSIRAKVEADHRVRMETLDKQHAHERALAEISAAKSKRAAVRIAIGAIAALTLAAAASMYGAVLLPKQRAHDALARAKVEAVSDDPAEWERAAGDLAVVRAYDPNAPELATLGGALAAKQEARLEKLRAQATSAGEESRARQREIDRLEREIGALRAGISAAKAAPSTSASLPIKRTAVGAPIKSEGATGIGGAKCPPGFKGGPLCGD